MLDHVVVMWLEVCFIVADVSEVWRMQGGGGWGGGGGSALKYETCTRLR